MSNLYIEIYGQGETIVMLHGWGMHTGVWREFAQELAHSYRVVCVDLPGHGRSPLEEPFELPVIASTLAQTLGNEPCCWLGWSLGGLVALEVAGQFPDSVISLILIASNPCFLKQDGWSGMDAELLDTFGENLVRNPADTLVRFLTIQLHSLPDKSALLKALKTHVLECPAPSGEVLSAGLAILRKQDLRSVLADLKCPVLAILGALDTLVPVSVAPQLSALLPDIQMEIFQQSGHVPFLSHPQATVRAISSFKNTVNHG